MTARKEVEEFLSGSPREAALAFSSLLKDDVQPQDSLVVVQSGGQPSLLAFTNTGDVVRFYFIKESGSEGTTLPRLERLQLAIPRGARVKLVGQLEAPRDASTWEHWTVRRTIVVTHDALPHGQIECELDRLDSEKQRQVDALFNSWLKLHA